MAVALILLALPALSLAVIEIDVSGTFDANNPNMKVDFYGSQVSIISDMERNTFRLNDDQLKEAVRVHFGQRPTDAFLRSPTPWNDLYQRYGWNQVQRTLRPRSAKILSITSQPQIVMQQIFENNSSKEATFNVAISQEVQNTISSSWNKGHEISVSQEINYSVDIKAFSIGGSTSASYTASWGENVSKSQTVTVGSSTGIQIVLKPGQGVVSELQANRGTIKVEVEYEASLSGHAAVNYSKRFKNHYFWALNLESVMSSSNIVNKLTSREVIDIGFFADARIIVHDRDLHTILLNMAC